MNNWSSGTGCVLIISYVGSNLVVDSCKYFCLKLSKKIVKVKNLPAVVEG